MRATTTASLGYRTAAVSKPETYGGGIGSAGRDSADALYRMVASCLLWEDQYYQSGTEQAKALEAACAGVDPVTLARVAIEARTDFKLRHVPLFLISQLDRRREMAPGLVCDALAGVIQRPDELCEFVAIHAKVNGVASNKVKPILSAQVKKGLAKAFRKFSAFQLAKWNRDRDVRLRDVLFLCHAKPVDAEQAAAWKALASGSLASADTWESALSAGADKRATWERLILADSLGDMAFLMNLRNMLQAKVSKDILRESLKSRSFEKILPFRFLSAARHAPDLEPEIDAAMQRAFVGMDRLAGRTLLVVDISGSMGQALSGKGEMRRVDAACAMAILFRGIGEDVTVYATAGNDSSQRHATGKVPARNGTALADAIVGMNATLGGGGVFLHQVTSFLAEREGKGFDRCIVITDEQDCDHTSERAPSRAVPLARHNYVLNVGAYDVGLDLSGKWTRVNGFSERVADWIRFEERGSN